MTSYTHYSWISPQVLLILFWMSYHLSLLIPIVTALGSVSISSLPYTFSFHCPQYCYHNVCELQIWSYYTFLANFWIIPHCLKIKCKLLNMAQSVLGENEACKIASLVHHSSFISLELLMVSEELGLPSCFHVSLPFSALSLLHLTKSNLSLKSKLKRLILWCFLA